MNSDTRVGEGLYVDRGMAGSGGGGDVGAGDTAAVDRLRGSFSLAIGRLCEGRELEPCLEGGVRDKAGMWGARRVAALDALMMAWGLGTWLGVNGLYVQLPLLVQRLPEQWRLPAAMALAVQAGNAGLLLYALLRRLRPRASDKPYIAALLALGALALLLNAFLYPLTTPVAGQERSVAFLALTLVAALVGCTSSVLFYPYLRHYRDVYVTTYLAGEGLSGLLPSALALVQGVGGEPECVPGADGALVPEYPAPRFGVTAFLLALAALAAGSLGAFLLLDAPRRFAGERVPAAAAAKGEEAARGGRLVAPRWLAALAAQALLSALSNGVLPAVQSFSCGPYGARAYHLAAALGAAAAPAACLAGAWLRPASTRVLLLIGVGTAPALGWALATAALSPAPPLAGTAGGAALVVSCWVLATAATAYGRMWVYGWARAGGARGMRAAGAAGQAGSAAGSLLLYALVNYTAIFTSAAPCPQPAAGAM